MKIFFAGLEGRDKWDVIDSGLVQNAFMSYYYIKKKKVSHLAEARKRIPYIIVDSGAHSFFSENSDKVVSASPLKKITKTMESPEAYFATYLEWLKENRAHFDFFVELDIGDLVGQPLVLKWRELLRKEGLLQQCITVYHPNCMTETDFEKMVKTSESKFVALEGLRPNQPRLPYGKLIKVCYEAGVRVHGFAMTKDDVFNKFPFYSVDSSSWLAGEQYGQTKAIMRGNNTVARLKKKAHAFNIKSRFLRNAYASDLAEQRLARRLIAIEAFNRLAAQATALWRARGIDWDKAIK